jgi:hypothetical protein
MEEKQEQASEKKSRKRKKTKEPEEDKELKFRTVRHAASSCIRQKQHMEHIQNVVVRVHRMSVLASILFNFFIREILEKNQGLPQVNRNFVLQFFYAVTKGRGKPKIQENIILVKKRYMAQVPEESREGIATNILLEAAQLMVTNFKNNINVHFYKRLFKGLKILEGDKAQETFKAILENKIDHELSPGKKPTLEKKFFITAKIQEILKNYNERLKEKIEKLNEDEQKPKEKLKKLFSVVPLVKTNVPHCITLDTCSIFDVFKDECGLLGWKRGTIMQNREQIWSYFFRFVRNSGKFSFHYRVVTDGIQFNVVYSQKKKKQVHEKGETKRSQEKIVENLPNGTRVAVDPGKHNIIYCVGFVNGKRKEIRYTNVQRYYLYFFFISITNVKHYRRFESFGKHGKKFRKKKKTEQVVNIENQLAATNSKDISIAVFQDYANLKIANLDPLLEHYGQICFRKLKWKQRKRTQQSEEKLFNKIKVIFFVFFFFF